MTDPTTRGKREHALDRNLDELYDLIDGIEVAMMTTRRPDGYLVSRPMQTQRRDPGADLWFVTNADTYKLDELVEDPHVNLAYYRDRTREWVSVSGTARISDDREKIRELYAPDWRAWFGDEGGERDGGPHDPRIRLILVEAHSATYLKKDRPTPIVLFDIVKGIVTGEKPDVGDLRELGPDQLHGSQDSAA